ncbi:MAG: hypothetical protein RIQ53_4180 [Pseudomonadota bacterium]
MTDPLWLTIARRDVGVREISGTRTAGRIAGWLRALRAWWQDDETPWCGIAVGGWMMEAAVQPPAQPWRARAWADWGQACGWCVGAVVVYERGGAGHVGLMVGLDQRGRILTLGGNQGDAVTIAPFEPSRVLATRWPASDLPPVAGLPTVLSSAPSSTREA